MNLNAKKVLITGSEGFIGSALKDQLQKLGFKVTGFDIENGDDIRDNEKLEKAIKEKFDAIYHLAGFSGSNNSNSDVRKCFALNSIATANIIKLVLKYSPKTKLILSGSRLEYGKPQYLPVDENHPTTPNSAYGISKLASTQLALVFARSNSLKTTIFRTSNVYGPHKRSNFKGYNVINYFIDEAKKGKTLTVFGEGKQIRDYIYISDLVDAFIAGLNQKANGQIYNLGYGRPIEFIKMTKSIIKAVGKGKIKFIKWPPDFKGVETGDYVSNINKIKNELGFKPKIDFEDGIKLTVLSAK
jgi:nucleoside-diphosphate-sugar epimerase